MKIVRSALIQHLQRITCNGQVTEVVFTGAFACAALTHNNQLLVVAPGLPKTKAFAKTPVGVAELSKLIKALGVLSGTGNDALTVDIRMEKHRLVVDEESRGLLRLMTGDPETVATRVDDSDLKKVLTGAPPEKGGIPLTRELVEGIKLTYNLFKATEVELFVGPTGGKVRVGNENADIAEFPAESLIADQEYSLLFGGCFVDVLGVITNFNKALLCLGGPDEMILVIDDGYKYLLSPQARSADEE